jgi:hypothetical protein
MRDRLSPQRPQAQADQREPDANGRSAAFFRPSLSSSSAWRLQDRAFLDDARVGGGRARRDLQGAPIRRGCGYV